VIGAGPGLGAALARSYGRKGFDVALVARNEQRLAALGHALQAENVTADWRSVDLADPAALAAAMAGFGDHAGRIDLVHHNAVAARDAPASQLSPAELLDDLTVGAASLLAAVQAALPYSDQRGLILATGSGAANRPMRSAAGVGVQKAALRNLVTALDLDLRDRGIRAASLTVNGTIASGTPFDPDLIAAAFVRLVDEYDAGAAEWQTTVAFPESR